MNSGWHWNQWYTDWLWECRCTGNCCFRFGYRQCIWTRGNQWIKEHRSVIYRFGLQRCIYWSWCIARLCRLPTHPGQLRQLRSIGSRYGLNVSNLTVGCFFKGDLDTGIHTVSKYRSPSCWTVHMNGCARARPIDIVNITGRPGKAS